MNYIDYLEWIAITLWSIETFPQILLNFKNSSTKGISNISTLISFIGKTTDIVGNYLLIIPVEYRILGFLARAPGAPGAFPGAPGASRRPRLGPEWGGV